MRLFVDVQKVSETGRRVQVSVPASDSLVLTNKTQARIFIYAEQSSRVGYPLEIQESLEVQRISETCDFFVSLEAEKIEEGEGLFCVSQNETSGLIFQTTNNVILNQQNQSDVR